MSRYIEMAHDLQPIAPVEVLRDLGAPAVTLGKAKLAEKQAKVVAKVKVVATELA